MTGGNRGEDVVNGPGSGVRGQGSRTTMNVTEHYETSVVETSFFKIQTKGEFGVELTYWNLYSDLNEITEVDILPLFLPEKRGFTGRTTRPGQGGPLGQSGRKG